MNSTAIIILIGSGAAVWVLLFPVRCLLTRAGIVDIPNPRSSHREPTARGGGVAISAVILATFVMLALHQRSIFVLGVAVCFCVLSAVSFVDDVKSLKPQLRLLVQATAAAGCVASLALGLGLERLAHDYLVIPALVVVWLWIVGYTNAFNFMDGINGISGTQAFATGVGTAWLGCTAGLASDHPAVLLALVAAGAGAGFLPHNLPAAKVFLGDAGSTGYGFLFSTLAVWLALETTLWTLFAAALMHANYVLDTVWTLIRRKLENHRLGVPHRDHHYQRLVRLGCSHSRVTCIYLALQIALIPLVVVAFEMGWGVRILVAGIVLAAWAGLFIAIDRRFAAAP